MDKKQLKIDSLNQKLTEVEARNAFLEQEIEAVKSHKYPFIRLARYLREKNKKG
ncbi:MAG: hypothetical protein LUF92_09605 [Clostridiales bacterium]|nr:hypothetical protein [Clostridiales bacterium]